MRPVQPRARFHCDYCGHVSTKAAMERHERVCFRNPDRFCGACRNTGLITETYDYGMSEELPCPFCKNLEVPA